MTGFEPSFPEIGVISEYCYFCRRKILPKVDVMKIGKNDIIHTNDICDKMYNELLEKMSDKVHEIWAKWMKYQFSKLINHHGDLKFMGMSMPPVFIEYAQPPRMISEGDALRWERQMNTLYEELPEHEKTSDREIAKEYLDIILKEKK